MRHALLPHPDSSRPHVRLGIAWFAVVVVALALGNLALAVVYGLAALVAAAQLPRIRKRAGRRPNAFVAMVGAVASPVALVFASWGLGAAILCGTAASVTLASGSWRKVVSNAGETILCWLPVGLAAASVVAANRIGTGAAVALVVLVSGFEAGDYLVGVDARWPWVGTFAGMAAVAVLGFGLAALSIPPFDGTPMLVFAAVAAVLIPAGQVMASLLLPVEDALASGLRRLDSLLLAGPAWIVLLWLYPFPRR
jgi:hypothetical protein